jgi:hypothetical protein
MFKLTADQARDLSPCKTISTKEEIVEKIESLIKKEAERGRTQADFIPTYKDQIFLEQPNVFKAALNKMGFSVHLGRNENPREGNNEVNWMRIYWNK